jgi:hypothetical protein
MIYAQEQAQDWCISIAATYRTGTLTRGLAIL